MNVVVVSNRVARAKADEPITGGLAAALLPAVKGSGAIWVGASGRTPRRPAARIRFAEIEALGTGALATVDLPAAHYRGYYEGFANSALWPALHSRPDLIRTSAEDYRLLSRGQRLHGARAAALLRPDSPVLGSGLSFPDAWRRSCASSGIRRPIGFFLHTPLPERARPDGACRIIASSSGDARLRPDRLPDRRRIARISSTMSSTCSASTLRRRPHRLARTARTRLDVFPIGIDVEAFANRATKAAARPEVTRLRSSLHGAKLVIGVDRVDYSKGIANRIRAFARMLESAAGAEARGVAVADRRAVARADRGLWPAQGRAAAAGHRRQRPAWRGRLDADPLSQQGLFAADAGRASIAPPRSAW